METTQKNRDKQRQPFSSRTDGFEVAYLEDAPRHIRFPFPVSIAGWVIAKPENYRSRHEGRGLEFCLRLADPRPTAVDKVGGRTLVLPFPHVLVKRPGVLHENRHDNWREAFFLIYPEEMAGAFRSAGILGGRNSPAGWPVTDLAGLRSDVAVLRSLLPRVAEEGVADEIDARAWALLVRLAAMRGRNADAAEAAREAGVAPPRTPETVLREFEASLWQRCGERIDFAQEARRLGFSRSAFYRRWTVLFGEAPERRLLGIRLDAAARLLHDTSLSIKQIASAVGDPSPAHFATAFRARYGMSPLAWRRVSRP